MQLRTSGLILTPVNYVRLPQKHVLEKMADKQKAVLKKAFFVPPRDCF